MKTLYTAHATAIGGREGHAETDDKKVSVDFSPPASGKAGTNPEQLFACGYGACFGGALAYIARQQQLDIGTPNIKVNVNLHQDDSGFFISAALDVALPALDHAAAEKLVRATHDFCPYSKATRGNITVTLSVNGQKLAA
jgi:osmotically inducible protein OsmC